MQENLLLYGITLLLVGGVLYHKRKRLRRFFSEKKDIVVHPDLYSKMVKRGYSSLNKLLYHNANKDDLNKVISHIERERSDGRYIGGYDQDRVEFNFHAFQLDYFYDIINYVEGRGENFISSLGSIPTQQKLNNIIRSSLGTLSKNIELPLSSDEEFSIEGNYLQYQKLLNKQGIQLAFLDDESDTYSILFFPLSKELEVKEAILDIGFDYKRVSS